MIVILSPTAQLAADTLSITPPPALSINAEYGAFVVEGTKYTSAYLQPLGSKYVGKHRDWKCGFPLPCKDDNIPVLSEDEVVIISNFKVSTIGGLMRASGKHSELFEDHVSFWSLVEESELCGIHLLDEDHPYYFCLRGITNHISNTKEDYPTDQNSEVTQYVEDLISYISLALQSKDSGKNFDLGVSALQEDIDLNLDTFLNMTPISLIIRKTKEKECNHLYSDPDGIKGVGVISYNEKWKNIKISVSDTMSDFSCIAFFKEVLGRDSKGDKTNAVSPPEKNYSENEFKEIAIKFNDYLLSVLYKSRTRT